MKDKLVIFTNHYFPENFRITLLSQKFSETFDTTVITQVPNYPAGNFYKGYSNKENRNEILNNVEIKRLKVIPRKQSSLFLALNYFSYIFSTYTFGLFSKIEVDHVFVYSTSPIFLSWGALKLAQRRKVKSTLYLLDLWPQSMIMALNIKNKTLIKILSKISLDIYKRFDRIVVSSKSFINTLVESGIDENKIIHIPQHADEILEKPILLPKIKDKIKIVFTGNIGEAQGLNILVESSKILIEENFFDFQITLVGDGRYKSRLEEQVRENNLSDYIKFTGQVPANEIINYLKENHFGYVSLLDVDPLNKTLPAKIQSYMAYGIPILASASGEVVDVISEAKCGIISKADDPKALAETIKKLKDFSYQDLEQFGINGNKYSKENYDINKINELFIQILKEG